MPFKEQRRVLGGWIFGARLAGIFIIMLALLNLPGMQFLSGRYTRFFDVAGSLVLLVVGVAWLFGVTLLIRFFDNYLSRN